jgi:hypothetical protein
MTTWSDMDIAYIQYSYYASWGMFSHINISFVFLNFYILAQLWSNQLNLGWRMVLHGPYMLLQSLLVFIQFNIGSQQVLFIMGNVGRRLKPPI